MSTRSGQTRPEFKIAPSTLAATVCRLGDQVQEALDAGVRWIHVDVTDGQFDPNLSCGPLIVEALRPLARRYGATIETYVMIVDPDRYVDDFWRAGADVITVHLEACRDLSRTVQQIQNLVALVAMALKRAMDIGQIVPVLTDLKMVMPISVEPGFGGQQYILSSLERIAAMRRLLDARGLGQGELGVDGGVGEATTGPVVRAGATVAVSGLGVFNSRASVADNVRSLCHASQVGPAPSAP